MILGFGTMIFGLLLSIEMLTAIHVIMTLSPGSIMQAQLEGRSVLAGIRRQGETGNRDQQGLNGDQISDDHAQERSPEMRAPARGR